MAEENLSEQLAAEVAEAVRRVLADAESRAAEIIREAEAEAAGIRESATADASQARERAEADARAQIEAAKRALDELGGSLAAAVSEAPMPPSRAEEPEPEPQPEPEPAAPEQAEAANGDDAAERLVAMKLAVDGQDSAAIEAELIEKFGPGDRTELLKEVLGRLPQ
jgi:hypothetical protein